MNTTLPSVILALLVFSFGSQGAPPVESKPADEQTPAVEVCPPGQAIVRRGETSFRVSVAEAFANARDNDRIQLGAGRAVAEASFTLKQVRGVHISGVGTTLVAKSDIPVVTLYDCEEVTLDGVHVIHEIGEWCAHACVSVHRGGKITIMNCDLDGSGYWGVCLWEVAKSRIIKNLFHNCHDGFSAYRCREIELRGNTFKGNRNADITADPEAIVNDAQADNIFGSAQDWRDHLIIVGTDSPDGRYAVAWGSPGRKVDRNDPHAILEEEVRLETWLVERETGEVLATLASTQWHPEMPSRYLLEVRACWRADSKAVMVVQHNRWSYGWVAAVLLDAGRGGGAEIIDLSDPLRGALEKRVLLKNPGEEDRVKGLSYSLSPEKWVGEDSLIVKAYGGFPKREDPLDFEEDVMATLSPEPPFIKITDVP